MEDMQVLMWVDYAYVTHSQ